MSDTSTVPPRILIIRLSALGDILHALPVLSALRTVHPRAHIGWIVQDAGAPLIEGHPMLDRVHVIPRRAMKTMGAGEKFSVLRKLRAELRAERYDVSIDLQGLAKSAVWGWMSGARERIGFKGEDARELSGLLYNRAVAPPSDARHVVEKNLSLLRALDIASPDVKFPVHFPEVALARAHEVWGCDAGAPAGDFRVIINPGAGWVTKKWPAEYYGQLAARLVRERNARVALAWGPGEEPLVRAAMAAAGAALAGAAANSPGTNAAPDFSARTIPAAPGVHPMPATSFIELGAAISLSHLLIAGDTGPLHFAVALGIPAVGIYGASDPVRNGPWGPRARHIQLTEPECIPCWKTTCRWSEPLACLTKLEVERVYSLCGEVLELATANARTGMAD